MSTHPSHPWYSVRLARWGWRLVWNRRMAWTLITLVSITVLFYQWENWRSARELVETRKHIIARIGTDNLLDLAPPRIPDEQNWFANAAFESWIRQQSPRDPRINYVPPDDALLPKGFVMPAIIEGKEGNAETLDLAAWMKQRFANGTPPPDATPEVLLARDLGDGNGLLPKLAVGLSKPYSMMKPGRREEIEKSQGNPWAIDIPNFRHGNQLQRQLALHLRSAALVKDQDKARDTALIMLRYSEASSTHALVGCLVSLALHGIAFDAMHDAMNHGAWSEAAMPLLQHRLVAFDDLQNMELALSSEALGLFQTAAWLHSNRVKWSEMFNFGRSNEESVITSLGDLSFRLLARYGPIGWHDANIAYWTDRELDMIGPRGPTSWLQASERNERVRAECQIRTLNPRRFLGAIAMPNLGSLGRAAAEGLFKRRCLIIACALERYRLQHGSFPESLDAVKSELAAFTLNDPARPDQPLSYRLEPTGYVLWSAGEDAKDDDGTSDKDWRWRLRRATKP